jgi:hypothetical protein
MFFVLRGASPRFAAAIVGAVLLGCGPVLTDAQAQTAGYPLVARSLYDGAVGSLFVVTSNGFTTAGSVTSWGFFDNGQPTSFQITPVILQLSGGAYSVTGVGTTRTNTASSLAQTFAFGLTAGSATVGPNFFIGWRDGNSSGTVQNAGVPAYDDGTPGSVRWFGSVNPIIGATPTSQGDFSRTYSIQTSVAASAPEPGSIALLATIALPLTRAVRRRKF